MKKYKIGFTTGVFDLFHIGHLNFLKSAKAYCDFLVVGVNTDDIALKHKGAVPIINQYDRMQIIASLECVDSVILCDNVDKQYYYENFFQFDALFGSGDKLNKPRWLKYNEYFSDKSTDVIFLPYTNGISSSKIIKKINKNI